MKSRIFRAVICLVLICCLVINLSPLRAKAVGPVTITTAAILGATVIALAAYCGFVFAPPDVGFIEDVGEDFEEFLDVVIYTGGFPGSDDDDEVDELVDTITSAMLDTVDSYTNNVGDALRGSTALTDPAIYGGFVGTMAAFRLYLKWMIQNGFLDRAFDAEQAPDGFMFYNQHILPEIPDDLLNSYTWLVRSTETQYYAYVPEDNAHCFRADSSDGKVYVDSDPSDFSLPSFTKPYNYASIVTDPPSWPDATDRNLGLNWGRYSIGISLDSIIWTNTDLYYDDGTIALEGSVPSPTRKETERIEPTIILGPISSAIVDGMKAADIPLPEGLNFVRLFEGFEDNGFNSVFENFKKDALSLKDGSMSLSDYQEAMTYNPSDSPDTTNPTDPVEPSDPTLPIDGNLANVPVLDFFAQLADLISAPFERLWNRIWNFFEPWLSTIGDWFSQVRADIQALPGRFETWFQDLIDLVGDLPDAVADAASEVKEAVQSLVVPEEDYLTAKVEALCAEFAFADSIVKTAQAMQTGLAGVTTEPPVIYINLGATRGSYNIGGTVPFLDLRWYAEYKPTVDAIISAFLWICFVWRMLLKLPGIISGMPGDFTMASAHTMGINDLLPSRSAEYEQLRIERRESIRKGRSK